MLRDLIDLVDKEDDQAAFIFLDQEKAFDRVYHTFLFKTMEAFGIGPSFIKWVEVLYSNASTKIKVNGYLSNSIPLKRGVRQGCPLSMLLYVLVIEVLALQLRKNPNIVGFQVNGEKIVSLHYADDAIITIKQNRCFKEVIKELKDYQLATGALINYKKTEGLWVGHWRYRKDTPLNIKWTSGNVKTLGVYFGNDDPAKQTFEEIIPKVKKKLNYWKQFYSLCTLAKARVIEIFLASKLWYAASFYNIPKAMLIDMQKSFFEFIKFPRQSTTISQDEMKKLRLDGGAKLIDIDVKSEAYRICWLIELLNKEHLKVHLGIITALIGVQKGGLEGSDLFFTTHDFATKILTTPSAYYTNAIRAITKFHLRKKIDDVREEKLFYNPTFQNASNNPLRINATCERNAIFTYGQVLTEYENQQNKLPHRKCIARVYLQIKHQDTEDRNESTFYDTVEDKHIYLRLITHKFIYDRLIKLTYNEHHHRKKWHDHFGCEVNWDNVWAAVHNPVSTEETKTIVWEQIHLNNYTTYSYNKWHKNQVPCPFCLLTPQEPHHIPISCMVIAKLWKDLEVHLKHIHPAPLSDDEKIFGIHGTTPNVILRNWLTYLFRQIVMEQEHRAFHNKKGPSNAQDIRSALNCKVKSEIWLKYNIYRNLDRQDYFSKIFAVNDYLIAWENEQWNVLTLFT